MPNNYYHMTKHLHRERYNENKRKEQKNFELYKKYGGEKEYYRQQYIKFAFKKEKEPLYILGGLDKDGGATLLETEPVVIGANLAGTAGLDGLTATDFSAGIVLLDGATPVVG